MRKRCDVLQRGLAIVLTVNSLAGCGSSPEIPSNPMPTTKSSLHNNNSQVSPNSTPTARSSSSNINPKSQRTFPIGGLTIWLDGDARLVANNEIKASNGKVTFKRQDGSPEQTITIFSPTDKIKITPKGTSGFVSITENVIELTLTKGDTDYEFPYLGIREKLSANSGSKSVSSAEFKVPSKVPSSRIPDIEECANDFEKCGDEKEHHYKNKNGQEELRSSDRDPPPDHPLPEGVP